MPEKPMRTTTSTKAKTSPARTRAPSKTDASGASEPSKSRAPRKAKSQTADESEFATEPQGFSEAETEERDEDEPTEVVAEVVAELPEEDAPWPAEAAEVVDPVDVDPDEAVERPKRRTAAAASDEADDGRDVALSRYDPMQAYLREVQRHPLLTPERELELATRYYTTGDVRSAHTLVTANLRLVVKIAYEYRRAYKNIMDLVQEGNVGLMQAVKKYDPSRGVKLSSYAAWWIRAYILRYILNNWRMVKLGTTQAQRKLFFNLNKEKQRLLAMGIDPSPAAIAKRLNVDEKEVVDMDVRLGSSEASLDAPIGDNEGKTTSRVDLMPSSVEAADVVLAEAEINQMLRGKLDTFRETLKGKDREIFDLRLVAPEEPLTLQQLGDRFGVSRERVRQLEARLVGKLRQHLHAELEEVGP